MITHKIQPGDTYYSVARMYNVADVETLRLYHNLNCPEQDVMHYDLIVGKLLCVPDQNEPEYLFTGNTNPLPQTEPLAEEAETETEDEASNPHDGKYFVIQKGTCQCDQGFEPATFKVNSHTKHYWNSPDADSDYLAVTENDVTFTPEAKPFGKCKLKPTLTDYQPCAFAPDGKWQNAYEKVKVMNNSCLTEVSELMCTTGGKITVLKHGQVAEISQNKFTEANSNEVQAALPVINHDAVKATLENGTDKQDAPPVNTEAPAKKIESLKLTYNDGTPITKTLSYNDKLKAVAKCTNMVGVGITFTLWEDDEDGAGHNAKNTFITQSMPIKVDSQGYARWHFTLLNTFIRLAQKREDDAKQHEYYVTATYNIGNENQPQLTASKNVNVNNPEYKVTLPPKKVKTNTTNASNKSVKPREDTPKASINPISKYNKPVANANITSVKFVDKNKQELLTKPKYGETLYLLIEGKNLKNKKFTLKLWEHDTVGYNDLILEKQYTFLGNSQGLIKVLLTQQMQEIGEYGTGYFKDSGEYLTGRYHEVFAEVILETTQAKSSQIKIDINEKFKANYDKSPSIVRGGGKAVKSIKNCEGKFCIKKGDKNELIREINIRLAGFGGNVPTDMFTDRTENMIKQFQRDYMKVPETGRICGNVLKAIDEFSKNFDINTTLWEQLKCNCSTKGKQVTSKLRGIKETNKCNGFGDKTGNNTSSEAHNKYEYPGLHRSLLFGFKALQFYFSKQSTYKIDHFTSGYRCRFKNYKTTNHQGKAIDIQFSKGNWEIRGPQNKNLVELRKIRDEIFLKYLGAQKNWPNLNLFSMEPVDLLYDSKGNIRYDHTFSWLHIDVRQFEKKYLEDKYFCTNSFSLNGKSIIQIATELGFNNLCACNNDYTSQNNNAPILTDKRVDPKTLKSSEKCKDFIKSWEGFYSKPYNDTEGYATIGFGYLVAYKKYQNITKAEIEKTKITWDEFKNGISKARAHELLNEKIITCEKAVQRDIAVNLYQHEFDALVSLLFNTGPNFLNIGGSGKGETKIKKNINQRMYSEGADEMSDVTNGGTVGLVRRRKAEIKMFKNNEYENNK